MTAIVVRAQEPHDVDDIADILNCPGVVAGTLQLPLRSVQWRREHTAAQNADVHRLVAEVERRVVGTLALHVHQPPRRRHCADLGMGVNDDFQGRGVGSALLAAAVDLADHWLGLQRIELTVYTDNAPAIHLYEKFGFVTEGTARAFALRRGVLVDALYMARLRLDA